MTTINRTQFGLLPETDYVVRVRSYNNLGVASDWSEALAVTTESAVIQGVTTVTIGTSIGAPTTGTWVAGQQWLDTNNILWVCDIGGQPGTWIIPATVPSWIDYTPTVTGSITDPTIGNGFIIGRYIQSNKLITFRIHIAAGSTSTGGSGFYKIALPVAAKFDRTTQVVSSFVYDVSSGNYWPGIGTISVSNGYASVVIQFAPNTTIQAYGSANWFPGGTMVVEGSYEAA